MVALANIYGERIWVSQELFGLIALALKNRRAWAVRLTGQWAVVRQGTVSPPR